MFSLQLFHTTLMMLMDRGFLIADQGEEDISLNEQRETGFEFLKCLIQPFIEGVWVREKYVTVATIQTETELWSAKIDKKVSNVVAISIVLPDSIVILPVLFVVFPVYLR